MRPAASNFSRAPPGADRLSPETRPPTQTRNRPGRLNPYLDALEAALEEAELVFTSYESPDGMSLMVTVTPFL